MDYGMQFLITNGYTNHYQYVLDYCFGLDI